MFLHIEIFIQATQNGKIGIWAAIIDFIDAE
jgi:hypothetical protein